MRDAAPAPCGNGCGRLAPWAWPSAAAEIGGALQAAEERLKSGSKAADKGRGRGGAGRALAGVVRPRRQLIYVITGPNRWTGRD